MPRKDISILVINKTVFEEGESHYSLEEHIKALKAYGYSVTENHTARNLDSYYNIIIANPLWSEISDLHKFHEKNPKVPIVFCSELASSESKKKIDESKIQGFYTDSEGCYYNLGGFISDFLKLIKHLSGKIYMEK